MNKETPANQKKGTLLVLLASLCFSIGGLLMKLTPWNPLAINGARSIISAVVVGIYLKAVGHRIRVTKAVLAGAVCIIGVTTLCAVSNKLTTAGNAIVLQYTAPIWIILFMFLFFRKRPGRKEILTLVAVLAGILLFFLESLSAGHILGDILALLAGAFYAGVFMMNQFENGDALSSVFLGHLLSGICFAPLVMRETHFEPGVILAVLVLGVVQMGLAYILLSIGTRYTEPVTASLVNAIEPILNPVLVALFYGEKLGPLAIAGAVIVIGGVLAYNVSSSRSARA